MKLNDEVGPYFQSSKGVRQGDPFSPFLFNLAADCLTKMILKAQQNGLFKGLASDLIPNGVAILQYADDTILCFEDNIRNALNIKLLLYLFEVMSGLKINFLKSEIFSVRADDETMHKYAEMFNCQIGNFPMKYLGMPVSYAGLKCGDWSFVEDKFTMHGENWISEVLPMGGRLIKVNYAMSHVPTFYMSMFLLNKTTLEKWDKPRRKFFWHKNKKKSTLERWDKPRRKFFWHRKGKKKGYHMVKWDRVCRSKKKGGLGVKDLRKQNISLLVKWWWKLDKNKGLWQDIVKAKYLKKTSVAMVEVKNNDSQCWKSLLRVKNLYMKGRGVKLNKGDVARLWLDELEGRIPFKEKFPLLFEICVEQNCSVDRIKYLNHITSFRRRMSPEMRSQWDEMKREVLALKQNDLPDEVYWKFDKTGLYSTKSMYRWLEKDVAGSNFNWIWDAKLPLKIQIFLWQVGHNAILTRDNMKKRAWPGNPCCSFCNQLETTPHLLFLCPVSRVI